MLAVHVRRVGILSSLRARTLHLFLLHKPTCNHQHMDTNDSAAAQRPSRHSPQCNSAERAAAAHAQPPAVPRRLPTRRSRNREIQSGHRSARVCVLSPLFTMAASIRKMSTLAKNSHVLSRLRESMASAVEGGLAAYIVPSGDPHNVRRWCVACVWRSLACLHRHTHAHTSVGIGVLCSAERVRGGARHEAHLPDRVLGVGWHR